MQKAIRERDWYADHLARPRYIDSLRERISGWFYRVGDWIMRYECHEVVVRDAEGRELIHVAGRIPTFNVPPPPYSVWCCDGRIDDGHGRIRGY